MIADTMARNLSPVICHNTKQKFHHYLHKNWDLSYIQCRLFHHTSYLSKRRKTREEKKLPKETSLPPSKHKQKKVIDVWKDMTVTELAQSLDLSVDDLLDLMDFVPNTENYVRGNSVIDNFSVIQAIVKQIGHRWSIVSRKKFEEVVSKDADRQPPPDPRVLVRRHPVVTVMGHVDHGKTTLLDTLRNTSVVEKEFGGITQHIGAFSVQLQNDRRITFLDTPGHAAFSAMRSRGASVTDIVVLVVAADDGVMEQTDESIRMARNAQVPIIVAINKIDKHQADIERTKRMLLERGIQLEDSGGDVQFVPISALKGTNVDALVDAILVQAEIMELKADPCGICEGVVIESKHDVHRGKLATVIVQRGTLKKGKIIVAGLGWAKVRLMLDDNQKEVHSAEPSTPVEVVGWRELPSAGDIMLEVSSDKRAREVMDWREKKKLLEKSEQDKVIIQMKTEEHEKVYRARLETRRKLGRFRLKPTGPREKEIKDDDDGHPNVSIIIKGDVDGSVEAILDLLMTYRSSLCKLDIVHFEVGSVTVSDVELAELFDAIIYAFNVNTLPEAKELAMQKGTPIHNHNVIYKLIDDLKEEINKKLPLIDEEEIIGEADILKQFVVSERKKKLPVAGCKCVRGYLKKSALFKVIRNNDVIYEGRLHSLRYHKEEVDTIKEDMECGICFEDPSVTFEPGDNIVCFTRNKKEQFTDWDPGF
ncbi:mitochondrial translation initiation factor 2 isoform X2 [Lycorma delicatula]